MVPDMRIALPHRGKTKQVLHELKVISCSQSRYNPNAEKRSVDTKASLLNREYLKKAHDADRLYNRTPEGQVGRVESQLVELGEVQGLVCGNWGEVSEAFHTLIAALATSRVRVGRLSSRRVRGRLRSEEAERSMVIASIIRRLGAAIVKAQASSLLG